VLLFPSLHIVRYTMLTCFRVCIIVSIWYTYVHVGISRIRNPYTNPLCILMFPSYQQTSNQPPAMLHPLTTATSRIRAIFGELGFSFADGPLIESEYYNFDALNVPRDHPARDMQDTFFVAGKKETVLRTHTSPVQIRYMQAHKGEPVRIVVPGRVFRNEATDATHEAQFFQVEGLCIDEGISLAHLKGTLEHFFSKFYERDITVRFRPGYFPFVEPGVEVDMLLRKSDGTERWVEVMGAGMVHPHVLREGGVDANKYTGFAFGGGIERLLMIGMEIDDVRLFHTGDLRFVRQFA
jgi:phenylalanyl-tRNA synthetase alpha chain